MNSQGGYGSSFMFESINNELNASLATADELSREFSSLLSEAAPVIQAAGPQSSTPQIGINSNYSVYNPSRNGGEADQRSSTRIPSSDSPTPRKESSLDTPPALPLPSLAPPPSLPLPSLDALSSVKYRPSSPSPLSQQHSPFMPRKDLSEPRYFFDQRTPPNSSPNLAKKAPPTRPRLSYGEQSPSSSPTSRGYMTLHEPPGPRLDRAPSPFASLPRAFQPFRPAEEAGPRQKSPSKWNESDLDAAYERKPHQSYDKSEWIRFPGPNSNWKESNLDAPPAAKDAPPRQLAPAHSSLPRNARISVPPDLPPSAPPIISRISMPPSNPAARQHRPIPLSVIMRLQNPHYSSKVKGPQPGMYQAVPLPREYFRQVQTPQQLPKQPAYYKEEPVRHPPDVDAEPERQSPSKAEALQLTDPSVKPPEEPEMPPRPLSPTRLQPVVAPQAELVGDLDELMRIRAEFPRALKKRGSAEVSLTLQDTPFAQPNPYKQMMNKLFRRKTIRVKEEPAAESGSSSDGEEGSKYAPSTNPIPITVSSEQKGIHSILRKSSKAKKSSNRRAHLSPLVLMLDGALVGELETVQRAAQEMSDPSQANDEGITALHNAICGGHFPVVEFLVRVGANVSAPDSHGWTPLHCAASCNDSQICEFLVRSGAAVMAVTDSDGATAAQKCDPFAPGFQECESFLRGVEEAMGVQNSGVVYALWAYPAQAPDELSFKEGDMVTILQKPEAIDWWWASLCGREGLVPNNYFGLFPKIRSKSLC